MPIPKPQIIEPAVDKTVRAANPAGPLERHWRHRVMRTTVACSIVLAVTAAAVDGIATAYSRYHGPATWLVAGPVVGAFAGVAFWASNHPEGRLGYEKLSLRKQLTQQRASARILRGVKLASVLLGVGVVGGVGLGMHMKGIHINIPGRLAMEGTSLGLLTNGLVAGYGEAKTRKSVKALKEARAAQVANQVAA